MRKSVTLNFETRPHAAPSWPGPGTLGTVLVLVVGGLGSAWAAALMLPLAALLLLGAARARQEGLGVAPPEMPDVKERTRRALGQYRVRRGVEGALLA